MLVEWFGKHYDVVSATEASEALVEGAIDLCVLDPAKFERYRDELIEQKEAQEPSILPYLLIRGEDNPLLDPEAQRYIDDVIVTPVGKRDLARRVEALLRLRGLSLELERKNEQLEYLLKSAAHDLRNPLNIAKGYVEKLEDETHVPRIKNALNRMSHLVDSFLTVSRTEQGGINMDRESIEFRRLIAECWEVVPTQRADLEMDVADDVRIHADHALLRQLIENLVRNAIEHGEGTVTIRIGQLSVGPGFYVADDGAGISIPDRKSVFEEGYSTKEGSGLGLAIVKRVVEAHGWDVRVTEAEFGGARLEITGVEMEP